MRVALIKQPPTYANWHKHPVLGLSYLSACLTSRSIESRIFDAYFDSWSADQLIERVLAYRPDMIGLSAMTHEIDAAGQVGAALKQRLGVPVVIGGCHLTALPERTLREYRAFDFGVYGEEQTFLELVEELREPSAARLYEIKGLVHRDSGQIIVNPPRPYLTEEDLNRLPYPSFRDYYGDRRDALRVKDAYYILMATRGCPYQCVFCMQVLGRKVRRRSPASVLDEIETAIERYGAHTINFADEIFLMDHPNTRAILQGIIDRGLTRHIGWAALTRANLVTLDLIALARRAGCINLDLGVESGDDRILKTLRKQITVEQTRNAVKMIKDHGIRLTTYYILGHPGETRETIKRTIDLAVELNTNGIAVGLMTPYPGTAVYDMARAGEHGYRLLSEKWSEYDKYGGRALAIEGIPHNTLVKYQTLAYVLFYLKNMKFVEMFRFLWSRKHALFFFAGKALQAKVRLRPSATESGSS
jgi:radical SAM superfamily enzyme YgiQ (UPF0313 family)